MNIGELLSQLALHDITTAPDIQALFRCLPAEADSTARLALTIDGLEPYAASWGDKAATWLVLAVARMIKEILNDYPSPLGWGCVPPARFGIVSLEDYQQEIGHRCLTGYQEIYAVLARTHRKPGSPIWHRRAVTRYFPQLLIDVQPTGSDLAEDGPC